MIKLRLYLEYHMDPICCQIVGLYETFYNICLLESQVHNFQVDIKETPLK